MPKERNIRFSPIRSRMRSYSLFSCLLPLLHFFCGSYQLAAFTESFPLVSIHRSLHLGPEVITARRSRFGAAKKGSSKPAGSIINANVSWDWQKVAFTVFQNDSRPIVLFDGICNLCNAGANYAIDHDPEARLRFASLQSLVGRSLLIRSGREPDDLSSIVFCAADGKAYANSEALLQIARNLEGPVSWAGRVGRWVPAPLRNLAVKFVSKNRHKLMGSEYDSCRLDFDGEFESRFVSDPELSHDLGSSTEDEHEQLSSP